MPQKFARVIPLLRTPIGVDAFDYLLPEAQDVRPGDLVRIPFRGRTHVGLVETLSQESAYAAKAVALFGTYADIRFPETLLALLTETAARSFTSKPTVLKAWLRHLPKKPENVRRHQANVEARRKASIQTEWLANPQTRVAERARDALSKDERVLILTPWLARARRYAAQIPGSAVLHGDLAPGEAFRAWKDFLAGEKRCLVSTRLGAWLSAVADRVILDEPENDDHKQDELSPRYDARKIALWTAQHARIALDAFGTTPPLHRDDHAPEIDVPVRVIIRHPQGRSPIPMIQSDTLLALERHQGPIVIIHPIRGTAARFVCRDCGWRAPCSKCGYGLRQEKDVAVCRQCGRKYAPPNACAACGGTDLGKSLPGIERMKLAWQKHLPNLPVEWRDMSNEAMDAPIPMRAFVVVTDGSLIGGATEDVRRRERQLVGYRRMASCVATGKGTLAIQSDESSAAQWKPWLTDAGMATFKKAERHERSLFRYPPSVRLVKAIVTGTENDALEWAKAADSRLQTSNLKPAEIRGPIPVAFRPTSLPRRWIYHLLFDPRTDERSLMDLLAPLASSAIMDLDPIAFLK